MWVGLPNYQAGQGLRLASRPWAATTITSNQQRPQPPSYPPHLPKRWVNHSGEIKWQGRYRFVGEAFAQRYLVLKRKRRGVWRVYYYHVLLGELHDADLSGLRPAIHQHPDQGPRKV
jgi:hypothetical protein